MKQKNRRGEIVVEATVIVTLVVLFITTMLYITMILYQQTLLSAMANQTASNLAQMYGNNMKDTFTGYVDSGQVYQPINYSNLKTDAYMDIMKQKANTFALYRLKSSSILNTGEPVVEVEVVKKPNELLKNQIIVSVQEQYEVPFLTMFGADGTIVFTATGRADCVDILEYINGVEAIGDPENSTVTSLPDSDTCLVTFVSSRDNGSVHAVVPVLRGKTINSSKRYSHSTMPSAPKYKDYEFYRWVTEGRNVFTANTAINNNVTVYGTWRCKITFDACGGSVNPRTKKVEVGNTTSLPRPSRNGYQFKGWYTQKNGGGTRYYSSTSVIDDNLTLYAHWKCLHNWAWKSRLINSCTERKDLYECTQCKEQKTQSAISQHDNSGRCNIKHNENWQDFHCTQGHTDYRGHYHVTCVKCYEVAKELKSVTSHGNVYTYWYWCGQHGAGSPKTPTH